MKSKKSRVSNFLYPCYFYLLTVLSMGQLWGQEREDQKDQYELKKSLAKIRKQIFEHQKKLKSLSTKIILFNKEKSQYQHFALNFNECEIVLENEKFLRSDDQKNFESFFLQKEIKNLAEPLSFHLLENALWGPGISFVDVSPFFYLYFPTNKERDSFLLSMKELQNRCYERKRILASITRDLVREGLSSCLNPNLSISQKFSPQELRDSLSLYEHLKNQEMMDIQENVEKIDSLGKVSSQEFDQWALRFLNGIDLVPMTIKNLGLPRLALLLKKIELSSLVHNQEVAQAYKNFWSRHSEEILALLIQLEASLEMGISENLEEPFLDEPSTLTQSPLNRGERASQEETIEWMAKKLNPTLTSHQAILHSLLDKGRRRKKILEKYLKFIPISQRWSSSLPIEAIEKERLQKLSEYFQKTFQSAEQKDPDPVLLSQFSTHFFGLLKNNPDLVEKVDIQVLTDILKYLSLNIMTDEEINRAMEEFFLSFSPHLLKFLQEREVTGETFKSYLIQGSEATSSPWPMDEILKQLKIENDLLWLTAMLLRTGQEYNNITRINAARDRTMDTFAEEDLQLNQLNEETKKSKDRVQLILQSLKKGNPVQWEEKIKEAFIHPERVSEFNPQAEFEYYGRWGIVGALLKELAPTID